MKCLSKVLFVAALMAVLSTVTIEAQNWSRLIGGAKKMAQALTLSDKAVQEYVHQYITDLDSKSQVLPASDAYSKRLARLTNGVTSVDGIPLNFKVYKTDDVNAFACADGSVRVYTGLMDLMEDDEVLGVIGHEIGHVANKDTKNAFKKALERSAIKDALASSSDKVAVLTDSQLGAIGEQLASAKYSRNQEAKADEYGYEYLVKAGKNPWAMATAFEKLQSLEGSGSSVSKSLQNFFSDHPDTASRIKKISERATKDGYTRPVVKAAAKTTTKTSAKKASTKKTSSTKKTTKKK